MIQVKNSTVHYINERALIFSENDLNDPQRVAVSLVSGTVVMAYVPGTIDYAADGNYERWTLKGYSTRLVNDAAHYIYARLSRTDRTALIVFSVKDYNIDGSITTVNGTDGTSITTDPSADYFYVKIGELTATDKVSPRELTYDSGLLSTKKGDSMTESSNMWELIPGVDPLINALHKLKDFTVKGFITLIGGLVFKNGKTEKPVADIKRSTDSDEDVPVGDDNLATSKYVESQLEELDDRFLSKVKPDETPYHVKLLGGLTATEAASPDYAKDTVKSGWAVKQDDDGEWYAEADRIVARILGNVYDLLVKNHATFVKGLSSEEFISGFTSGKGWAIRMTERENAAGETERKSLAEFDDLIVRGTMRVYEFIVSQMLGENDNRVFTGMMEVDHYDASDGRIYLRTDGGRLYNPFRKDDVLVVQQYGGSPDGEGGHYVTKQYELVVTEAGIGQVPQDGDRLDWITFSGFSTSMEGGGLSLIQERDTLVRIDNLSDVRRKGIIQMMSVGDDTPYMDIVYGAKTDPENSLKGRFGNIGGVYSPLFGWLREFGAYLTNLYAVGEFRIAHTGEDVADAIEVSKGQFRTNYRQTTYDMTEEDNFLTNAAMTNNCEHWVLGQESTSWFLVDDMPQFFNYELYGSEGGFAGIAERNGRDMLRLSSSTLLQENALIRKPGTHKVHTGTTENADGTYTKVYEEIPDTLYLSLRVYCAASGTVEVGFTGGGGAYYENDFHVLRELEAREDAYEIKVSSTWDGIGDFCVKSSGDVYIDLLSLTDRPLENFMITTSTSIEQDAQRISLLGKKVNGVEGSVTDLNLEVNSMAGTISSTVTKVSGLENTIATAGWINESDSVRIFAEQVTAQGVAKKADLDVYVKFDPSTGKVVSGIKLTADQVNISANDYISIINKGTTTISASRVDLSGLVTISNLNSTLSGYATDGELSSAQTALNKSISDLNTTLSAQINTKATTDSVNSLNTKVNDLNKSLSGKADSSSLGSLAYVDDVRDAACAGSTLVVGGYLNTDYVKVKTIEATKGFIAGFNIVGNDLTNEGYDNDASVIFRNDTTGKFAAIGGNVLPASTGLAAVARFENKESTSSYGGQNYAMYVSAQNGYDNVAININGGCVSGMAMRNTIISSSLTSKTLDRTDYNVLALNTSACTVTLPSMELYDDGHVIRVKRLGGGQLNIKLGYCHTWNGFADRYGLPVLVYNNGDVMTPDDVLEINGLGYACEFVWCRDLSYTVSGKTYYGAWVQYKLPTGW